MGLRKNLFLCLFLFWPGGFRNPVTSPPGRVSRVTGASMWVAIDDHLGAFGGHGRPFGVRWIGIWGNVAALDAHWVVRGGHLGSIWWPDAPGWLLTPIWGREDRILSSARLGSARLGERAVARLGSARLAPARSRLGSARSEPARPGL